MFLVEYNHFQVRCETADDVRQLVGVNGHVAQPAKVRRPYKRKVKENRRLEGVKASWDKARKIAKKLGRKDVMAVRSELRSGALKDE